MTSVKRVGFAGFFTVVRLQDGRIAKHYESVDPDGHSKVVLEDIKALKVASYPVKK